MNNITMLQTALDAFKKIGKDSLPFESIFDFVWDFFEETWIQTYSDKKLTKEQIMQNKRGELYKLLTIDGNFQHLPNGNWTILR
ncbi:hypothetical protein [Mycoplasma phocoenae]|uniref:Uncharacterized protein n=1 Tax=Mycoplasma phocoenae TaxID=754517 RepID=A0A858U4E7_9MOLU|nr:hypothetical protein [Mycoplasma phocoenae]QJG66949.1 hypothetical protein HGG69_01260 [Mycoplasma phocoenae]